MADIFVSYAHEDKAKAKCFVELFEKQGWSVWWDRSINPGARFGKVIEHELSIAKCVLVLWTKRSIISDWVQAEAGNALERGILIPVQIEDILAPLIFRQTHTAFLFGWPEKADDVELAKLIGAISQIIAKPILEPPAGPRSKRMKVAPLSALLLAGIVASYFVYNRHAEPISLPAGNSPAPTQPIASIAVFPFKNMTNDVAFEVVENLARSPLLTASMATEAAVLPDAGYSLQAIQIGNQLSVSMRNNENHTTQFEFQVNLEQTPTFETAQLISKRIAREFGQTIIQNESLVPETIYIQYLTARAELRDSQTPARLDNTINILSALVNEYPRFTEAQASLCTAYLSLYEKSGASDDFERAEKHCFRASRLSNNDPWVDIAVARMFRVGGQLNEARSSFEKALDQSPFLTEAMRGLAQVQQEQGELAVAIKTMQRAQNVEPSNWRNYQILGLIYFGVGKFSEAVSEYENALARVGNKPLLLNDLGAAHFMLGDFPGAIHNWEASIEIEPNYSALSNLGSAYYFNRQFDKALEAYERAIEISDQDYTLWLNAGEAAYHAKTNSEKYYLQAINLAEAHLKINPDDNEALAGLALCFSSVGNESNARAYLAQALLGAADDIYVLYFIAVTYARLGEPSMRNQAIERLISRGYSKIMVESDANFD